MTAHEAAHAHPHHHHDHSGGHSHQPTRFGRAFAWGVGLNAAFVGVEVVAGLAGHSVALQADAGHNISDVLGLLAAWLGHALAQRAPTARFTFGFGSSSMLAALFNAVLLLVVVGALSLEALQRLSNPQPVAGGIVIAVAAIGVIVNGATAMLFAAGRHDDLNLRGAYLHMAADALVSIGIIAAGIAIVATGWLWLDPLASLLVNAVIVVGTFGMLRDAVALCLNAVPRGIKADEVRDFLIGQQGVLTLHDFHIWPMSTTEAALSAHLVIPAGHPGDPFLAAIATQLRDRFKIGHVTLQIETDSSDECLFAKASRHQHV